MPLHEKDSVSDRLNDDVYGSVDLAVGIPKYKMPDVEHDRAARTPWWRMN